MLLTYVTRLFEFAPKARKENGKSFRVTRVNTLYSNSMFQFLGKMREMNLQ